MLDALARSGFDVVDLKTEEADLAAIFRQLTRGGGRAPQAEREDEYR